MSLPELQPGDCLLYFKKDLLDYAIAFKTWNLVAHVEIYVGNGMSIASRNGLGVNQYPLRTDGLIYVRRPQINSLYFDRAMEWFNKPYNQITQEGIRGQGYDWKGLLCFTLAVSEGSPNKMFCSEFATRWYREAMHCIVAYEYDADKVEPAQFLKTPVLRTIYEFI